MAVISAPTNYVQTLTQAGLTKEQAQIYEVLIKNGPLPASRIHHKTPFKRGLVYKLLDQLADAGLVAKKDEVGKVSIFEPAHPLKLVELAEKKEEQARNAQTALESIIDSLTSEFNLAVGKPGIRTYEGLIGIKKTHEEILRHAKNLKIFASNIDAKNDEIAELIRDQTNKQRRLGITTQALVAGVPGEVHVVDRQHLDSLGISIKKIPHLQLPSQIIIFEDFVAISSFDTELVTTIIQNNAISKSFKIIFDILWETQQS